MTFNLLLQGRPLKSNNLKKSLTNIYINIPGMVTTISRIPKTEIASL